MFPHRKDFGSGVFAYIAPLLYGRARIHFASSEMFVDDLW